MGLWSRLFRRDARDSARNLKALAEGPPINLGQLQAHMKGMTRAQRRDAWQNILTAVGTAKDKRSGGEFVYDPVLYEEAKALWLGDPIAKRVIEWLPKAGMRKGFDVKLEKKEQADKIEHLLRRRAFGKHFVKAAQYERAYGGGAIWPVLNDSSDYTTPLELDSGAITIPEAFVTYEPRELIPVDYYADTAAHYGEVEIWRIQPIATRAGAMDPVEIHASRLIIFPGIRVSKEQTPGAFQGWGGNVLTVMREVMRDYNLSWGAGIALLQEISIGVFKMKKLGELIENDRDDVVADRLLTIDVGKSVTNSIAIDAEDDYQRVSGQFSGFDSILVQFETRLAQAADMTVTNMMGQSPAGMNATGESDIIQDDDRVIAYQDEHIDQTERVVEIFLAATDGPTNGNIPETFEVEYRPLRQMTEKEKLELRKLTADIDAVNIPLQIYSADDAAKSHYGSDTFSSDIHIDWPAREAQAKLDEEQAASDAELMKAIGMNPDGTPIDPAAAATDPKAKPPIDPDNPDDEEAAAAG